MNCCYLLCWEKISAGFVYNLCVCDFALKIKADEKLSGAFMKDI